MTKSQKEQLTERFQLKVTISRREDWELAVREADQAVKQTSETRLEEIDPKVQFYTSKTGMNKSIWTNLIPYYILFSSGGSKGQSGRKSKVSAAKHDESSGPPSVPSSSVDASDRSLLAEKTFEFKSEEETSEDEETPPPKTPSVKIKLKKQTSNDSTTPPAKRRYVRKSAAPDGGKKANGQRTSTRTHEAPLENGNSPGSKRGRQRLSKPSVITSNGDNVNSDSSSTTPKTSSQRKSIKKPQAFMNKVIIGLLSG